VTTADGEDDDSALGDLRDRLVALGRRVGERAGLRTAAVLTAAVLLVVLYVPVGLVLGRALLADGRPSPGAVGAVLTDPFYVGVLADVLADPLAVDRHLAAFVGWLVAVLDWLLDVVDPLDPGFYLDLLRGVVTAPVSLGEYGAGVEDALGLFGFTAYQAAVSTVVSVAVGLPGAWLLSRFEFPGRRALRSLTVLPFVLPGIMVAGGFVAAFGVDGTFNDLLAALGAGRVGLVGTLELVVVAHAFYNAPLVTRVTTAAWETVDRRAVETARTMGASRRRAVRDVVLPQLTPAIATGALLVFLFTFMTFPIVLALGGLQLATVEVWVFDRVTQLRLEEAAALAVVETVVTLGVTYVYLRYEARSRVGASGGVADRGADRKPLVSGLRALTPPGRLAVVAYGLLAVGLFVLPIASMVVESFTVGDRTTLANWEFLFRRQVSGSGFQTKPWPAVRNSLVFAAGTLALAVPMGVAVAALTTGRDGDGDGAVVETLALAPLAVSGIVVGVGLLEGLVFGIPVPGGGRVRVTGPVAIVAAHAVAAYPFVVRSVAPQLAAIDRETVESARVLGATRTRALLDVELPLVAAGIVAGAALAVAISVGEFDTTVILAQGGQSYTMPVAVERYLARPQNRGPAMAMGTVLLVVTSGAFLVVDRVGGRVR
jgi:thiamine transport system permease protein